MFDRILAIFGLATLFPIIALSAIAIKLDSRGPVLFIQDRVGLNKKKFKCFKFRTMSVGTPNVASHLVGSSSVTTVGKYIRTLKIDEIPQLYNVLKGDMRLVGYRPCLPGQADVISHRDALNVFRDMPGITGLAQISKVDMSTPEKLAALDNEYISNRTFMSDIAVLLKTVAGAGSGDAAERS